MSSVGDIWASMQDDEERRKKEYNAKRALSSLPTMGGSGGVRMEVAVKATRKGSKRGLTKEQKRAASESVSIVMSQGSAAVTGESADNICIGNGSEAGAAATVISASAMMAKLGRDINIIDGSESSAARRKSLAEIHANLFARHSMSEGDYNEVFREVCRSVFKKFADPAEKCRELTLRITLGFFERGSDFVPVLGYLFPAFMQRVPAGLAYDEDMKVFVHDIEAHEAYRRGKAVERQDRTGSVGPSVHTVVEPSEEIRFLACTVLRSLIEKVCALGACSVLNPYFHEVIMYLQSQLRDPFPDLKAESCDALSLLAAQEDFVPGMKFFAVGLVRAVLPVLRHRHAKVRAAAVGALKACLIVPDRAKVRGAGSEAIFDIVGFREDNVLPVAAFYTTEVRINYLAELVTDKALPVRERVVDMLAHFLTELPDRYDHQTRLLPYLLDLLTDECESVSTAAMRCLQRCGQQYESEHDSDIIDRRQYGVDGDDRINLAKPLPPPFKERPRIGVRLYVRGNTKRFLSALVAELTNWQSKTRLKSGQLLKVIIVLCEEHLTMEAFTLLPAFIKALGFAREDKDPELHALLLEVFELVGRFMLPDTYIHYILPRLRGDTDVVQFGADAATRGTVLDFLGALLEGTKPALVPAYFEELTAVLTNDFYVDPESPSLPAAALRVLATVLHVMKGRGRAAVAEHFLHTGRLSSLKASCRRVYRTLLLFFSNPQLRAAALEGLYSLAAIDSLLVPTLGALVAEHTGPLLRAIMGSYEVDNSWHAHTSDHLLLAACIDSPLNPVMAEPQLLAEVLCFACGAVASSSVAQLSPEVEAALLEALSKLVAALLAPLYCTVRRSTLGWAAAYSDGRCLAELAAAASAPVAQGVAAAERGLWPGAGLTASAASPTNWAQLQAHFPLLLDAFVFDDRWDRSASLMESRLELLAMLLAHPFSRQCAVPEPCSRVFSPAADAAVFAPLLDRIVKRAIVCAVLPTSPLALRRAASTLLGAVLSSLRASQGDGETVGVFSFARQAATGLTCRGGRVSYEAKPHFRSSVAALLSCLDDSNDDARLDAVGALSAAVPLLHEDDYAAVVAKCIFEACAAGQSSDFLAELEELLRGLAVLAPYAFGMAIRARVDELLPTGGFSAATELLSGLLEHAELLVGLQQGSGGADG